MYPEDWEDIAKEVKDAANWCCIKCGHKHEPQAGYTLTVHHINGVTDDCELSNLVAVCQRCHLRMQVYAKAIRFGQISLF